MPQIKEGDGFREASWEEAIDVVASRLAEFRGEEIGGLGGARGTNEDAYAVSKFARVVLGTNNVDSRMDDALSSHFLAASVDRATISDLDDADTILIWGPDLKEEHPTLYLRVRRAVQDFGTSLVVIHPRRTGLDDRATIKVEYRPGGGFQLLDEIADGRHEEVAHALSAEKVVALVGIASHADGPELAESVAALVRQKAGRSALLPLNSRSNTYGALDMGLAPDLLPGRVNLDSIGCANLAESWGEIPKTPGRDTRSILEGLDAGDIRGLLLVGADPLRDTPDPSRAIDAFEAAEYVVSIDMFLNDSNRNADVVLPAAGFAEKSGTVTNIEGRVQKLNQIRPAPGQSRPDWAIVDDIATAMASPLGLASSEIVNKEVSAVAPAYEDVTWDLLEWDKRDGVVVPIHGAQAVNHIPVVVGGAAAPRADLTLHVARTMYDDGVRLRHSPSLHKLAPGPVAHVSPTDAPKLGAKDGHQVRVVTSRGEGQFTVVLDEGTPSGVVYIPFNQVGGAQLGTDSVVRVTVVST